MKATVDVGLPLAGRPQDQSETSVSGMGVPPVKANRNDQPGWDARATQPRFTLDGSRELEENLARSCAKIVGGLRGLIPQARLEAVLLGGGYGRGEGGVLRTAQGDLPYNDLEFYVCIRGHRHLNELRFGRALHVLGEILTPQAGVEVEFKITSLRELARSPVSMYSYDLLMGHRRLAGDGASLDVCAHHRIAGHIPLAEATRLMMNRCTGLLFAKERLAAPVFTAAAADFVARNIAKAQLALGDAVLAAFGRYHWSVRERHRELIQLAGSVIPDRGPNETGPGRAHLRVGREEREVMLERPTQRSTLHEPVQLIACKQAPTAVLPQSAIPNPKSEILPMPWLDEVVRHHASGVEFKLHPARSTASRETLVDAHQAVSELARKVWLWLEERRLGGRFATVREYATSSINKCPEASAGRNALINLKLFGLRPRRIRAMTVHPRNRVLQALPLLLWEPSTLREPGLLQHLGDELQTSATEFPGLMKAYRAIWERVN